MKIQRVLLAVDFSEPALSAVRWARRCLNGHTDYVLVHAVDVPQPPAFLRGSLPPHDELVETARTGALTRLQELARDLPGKPRLEVRVGRPAEQVAAVAQEAKADLIIVGEHGRRRGIWQLLGSTAERLIRTAAVPVLLARGVDDTVPATILAPIDESPPPDLALRWTRHLAERFDARVVALHVLDPAITGRVRLVSAFTSVRHFEDELVAGTRQWLDKQTAAAGLPDGTTEAVVSVGNPSYEIIAAAERHEADLIVMTSRGTAAAQRLLGSVARAVLRAAGCSVLALTAELE